ncbi:hypothetical protein [Bryobacter aggregatus]|uniref:hypothetical protein n=1 Tax=Bryobacter aggregatus TaxID=360054 RepID=UPI0012BAEAF7|nr:hypothetical protein [Bryobacter aggregatus]
MLNLEELRKNLTQLADKSLLEVDPEGLTDAARSVYEAEMQSRGIQWPSAEPEEQAETAPAAEPGADLVLIDKYESLDEARLAAALLRNEGIPVWLAGALNSQKRLVDANAPLQLVTQPDFLEHARLVLASEVSEEELARQAEEAGAFDEEEDN